VQADRVAKMVASTREREKVSRPRAICREAGGIKLFRNMQPHTIKRDFIQNKLEKTQRIGKPVRREGRREITVA